MNIGFQIKKRFNFLIKYGFLRRTYSNGLDYEVCYRNPNLGIDVIYALAIPSECTETISNSQNLNQYANLYYGVDIILSYDCYRENLLSCTLFDNDDMNNLISSINRCKDNPIEQLTMYSMFLKNHISKLMHRKESRI